jgi:hypothetical protein
MQHASERARLIPLPRCPYCHEDVSRGALDLKVCAQCHAFQHDACWVEARGCAACGDRALDAAQAERAVVTLEARARTAREHERARRSRRRDTFIAGLLVSAFLAGVAVVVVLALSAHSNVGDPVATVRSYFGAMSTGRLHEGFQGRFLVSPLSTELFELEHGFSEEPLTTAETDLKSEVTILPPSFEPSRATVRAGARSFELVPDPHDHGHWLLDRTLADEPVAVLGVRFRPPFGLEQIGESLEWRRGDLTLAVARESGRLRDVSFVPRLPDGTEWIRNGPSPKIDLGRLGVDAISFSAEDSLESTAIAYVELAPGVLISFELRGPGGHGKGIVELLEKSVATLELFPAPESRGPEVKPVWHYLDARTGAWVPGELEGHVNVWLETFAAPAGESFTIKDVVRRAHPVPEGPEVRLLGRSSVPGRLLPERIVYTDATGYLVIACGIVDGKGRVLRIAGPSGANLSRAALARLEVIADSFSPEKPQ